jgi:hypothetical protein
MRAPRVEECRALEARDLVRRGYKGTIRWSDNLGRDYGSIGWRRVGDVGEQRFELHYTVTREGQTPRDVAQTLRLERMPKPLGGSVWAFRCPLVVNGTPCRRRVLRLYLAPSGVYFGCRVCYGLAYRSSLREDEGLLRALARFGISTEYARLWFPAGRGGARWMS